MNPYTILGVPKDADDQAIKQAYRKLAAEHHPDKGGDKEQFLKVQAAYELLSNPERRQRYDEFGDLEKTDLDTEARTTLTATMLSLVTKAKGDAKKHDLVKIAHGYITEKLAAEHKKIPKLNRDIRLWRDAINRLKIKGDGENFITPVFEKEILSAEAEIKLTKLAIEVGNRILKLLDGFEWVMDTPEPEPPAWTFLLSGGKPK